MLPAPGASPAERARAAGPAAATAGPAQELLRKYVRPDLAEEQAVVVLLDAVGTLRELKACARRTALARTPSQAHQ